MLVRVHTETSVSVSGVETVGTGLIQLAMEHTEEDDGAL